jgi:hypothetical protein
MGIQQHLLHIHIHIHIYTRTLGRPGARACPKNKAAIGHAGVGPLIWQQLPLLKSWTHETLLPGISGLRLTEHHNNTNRTSNRNSVNGNVDTNDSNSHGSSDVTNYVAGIGNSDGTSERTTDRNNSPVNICNSYFPPPLLAADCHTKLRTSLQCDS